MVVDYPESNIIMIKVEKLKNRLVKLVEGTDKIIK
jgi:hypothetical protein